MGEKNKLVAGIFGILLGSWGIHKFYLGKVGQGVLHLMFFWTGIPAIIGLVEGVQYLMMSDDEFNVRYNMQNASYSLLMQQQRLMQQQMMLQQQELVKKTQNMLNSQKKKANPELEKKTADELAAWFDLKQKGIIDDAEYEKKRIELLDGE